MKILLGKNFVQLAIKMLLKITRPFPAVHVIDGPTENVLNQSAKANTRSYPKFLPSHGFVKTAETLKLLFQN